MTTTYDIARSIVYKVGGNPGNTAIVRAVAVWITFESGSRILGNNPLNMRPTSYPAGVQPCGVDNKNFIKFCSLDDATSTIAYQLNKKDWRGFDKIGAAIRAGSPLAFFSAVARSAWSSDHYGGGSKLINAFNSGANYNKTLTFGERSGGTSPGGGAISGSGSSNSGIGSQINAILTGFGQSFPDQLKSLGIPSDPTHVITDAEATKWANWVANTLGGPDKATLAKQLHDMVVNKTVDNALKSLQGAGLDNASPPSLDDIGAAITDSVLTFVVVLIGLVFIIGAFLLFRSNLNKGEAV